jgi:hypothetical protein
MEQKQQESKTKPKNLAEASILPATLSDEEFTDKLARMLKDCEEQEALKRVESF